MKKAYLILLPLAMLAAAACQSLEPEQPGQSAQGPEIRFSSSIGDYTKATDKSFEAGDLAGLSISDPVNVSNVKLTYAEGTFTPERTLYWALDQAGDKKCTFLAYSPYSASIDPGKAFAWTIPADQSAAGAYAAADLVTAKTLAGPADGTVHLSFNHALSRMVLTLENKVAEDEVAGVKLNGVKLGASVDISAGTATATGDAAAVTPAAVSNAYVFLVAPQTVSPEILITMKSGKVVRYTPDAALNFAAGKQLSAAITVEKDKVLFSAEILDWLDEKAYLGKTEDPGVGEHTWYVEYNGGLQPFEKQADGTYHQVFSIGYNYAQIRIVKDDYAEIWGCALPNYNEMVTKKEPTSVIPLAPNYYFYLSGEGDLFDLVLDMKAKTLTVTLLEHKWESLGTGIFIDGFATDVFELPHEEIEVEVMADVNAPGVYRIMNPYKNWSWTEEFNYTDGGFIELHTLLDGRVWMAESFLGLSLDRYGDFYGLSLCPEVGWNNFRYYGQYYSRYGFFQFVSRAAMAMSNYGTTYANQSGLMSLTLPGFERPVHDYSVTDKYVGGYFDEESGQRYLRTEVKTGMDVAKLKYGVFAGSLSSEEVWGTNDDGIFYTQVVPGGTEIKFTPDEYFVLSVPVPQTGAYTILWYGENAAGEMVHARFQHYSVLFDGDEAPAASASISAAPAQPLSDLQATAHVTFTDPSRIYLLAVKESAWTESGLTDDDVYDYVLSNGVQKNVYVVNSKTGADYMIEGLAPQTAYRVFVAGTNGFNNPAWAQATVTTEASPTFTSMGNGHYTDDFINFLIEGGNDTYRTEAEILKAETTPVRYRLAQPYKEFWKAYEEKSAYNKREAEYIDFYLKDDELYYDPFYIGYEEEDLGAVRYYSRNPSSDVHLSYNTVLQEGVYNLAPYAKIEGSRYYYDLTSYWEDIYIEMPGYTYTPEPAPARAQVRKNLVEAPAPAGLMVQDTVRPFTRHMLNTGTPKVTRSQRQFSEISAEPIK